MLRVSLLVGSAKSSSELITHNSPLAPLLKYGPTYTNGTAKERGENIVSKIYSRKLAEISGRNIFNPRRMNIEALEHEDLSLIPALQPEGWDIMSVIEFYTKVDFCYPIKVTRDHTIIGIGTTIIHNDVAWLAHIIVHDQYRNQGIGRLITQTLIEKADAEQCETIYLLATEMGEPVYAKLGFEAETEYLSFKGKKITEVYPATENILPYASDFKHQISILDREASGEDRMFHLELYLSNGFVYVEGNVVLGYYLPAFGDGLIIAKNISAGQALMTLRLTTKDFAVFPKDNEHATALMNQLNFTAFRTQKRMRLGKKRDWQPANIYNRIGGNLG